MKETMISVPLVNDIVKKFRQKFPNNKEVRMITLLIMVNLYSLPYEIII